MSCLQSLTTNFSVSLTVKEFGKSVKMWQSYHHEFDIFSFWNTAYVCWCCWPSGCRTCRWRTATGIRRRCVRPWTTSPTPDRRRVLESKTQSPAHNTAPVNRLYATTNCCKSKVGTAKYRLPRGPKPLNGFRWNSEYITMSQIWSQTQTHVVL